MENQNTPLQQELLSKGFKKHTSESYRTFKCTDTLFQKRVEDELGILYFIDAWYYPSTVFNNGHEMGETIEVTVQYRDQKGDPIMNVTLFEKDIDKAEVLLAQIWCNMSLGYYEKWE